MIVLDGFQQILWPVHCVQEGAGAEFAPVSSGRAGARFRERDGSAIDSYSGFFDNGHRQATGLGDYLREHGVTDVYLTGLATDYCVKFTALDALELGFRTHVIEDACRGVNLEPGDTARALEAMREAGATVLQAADLHHDAAVAAR